MAGRKSFGRAARKLGQLRVAVAKSGGFSARIIGEEVMTDVKASRPGHGVPVDEGTLRGTGRVTNVEGGVVLSFGGPAAPYALDQHERLEYRHTVGEARYLVRGLERFDPNQSRVHAELRGNWTAAIRAIRMRN